MIEERRGPEQPEVAATGPEQVAVVVGATADGPLGAHLEPALRRACQDRLGPINWFRTDWQRGGALTGYSTYRMDDGDEAAVVVKLPVPPVERTWLRRLQDWADVVPRVYADGTTLDGYDMAWVIMERMPHGPLGAHWEGAEFDLIAEAAGRFYAAAQQFPVTGPFVDKDWEAILARARQHVHDRVLSHEQRWSAALKKAHRKLKDWLAVRADRPNDQWCHGDLHLANAMTRVAPPGGPAVLLDLARVRRGHWLDDAVYLEHLYWCRRDRLGGRKLCSMIARQRKQRGLAVLPDWPRWADIQRTLIAMSTPLMLEHDGASYHVQAALEVLERAVH